MAAGRARPLENAIELAHVENRDGGWLLSLHLRRGSAGAHAGVDNVAIRPAAADAAALHVASLHSPAGNPDCLEILLRAGHGAAPAVGAAYSVQLTGLPGLDGAPASARFVLDADAGRELDPRQSPAAAQALPPAAEINYLAKDYASFRQLMFDQMNLLAPEWKEHNAADLGVAMIETLAYAADYLSYEQDAVATEAYLSTARRRSSLKRHSRLLGYDVQDGSNARVWVHVEVNADDVPLPAHSVMLTAVENGAPRIPASFGSALPAMHFAGHKVFETMHDAVLSEPLNKMWFHHAGASDHALDQGSTSAVLVGHIEALCAGHVLQFEAVAGSAAGELMEPDPRHRHTVRLQEVRPMEEAGQALTYIGWGLEDALPFRLAISARAANGRTLGPLAVARGNIVLADCGLTLYRQPLSPARAATPYRPALHHTGLTWCAPLTGPAALACSAHLSLHANHAYTLPAVTLRSVPGDVGDVNALLLWTVRRDLLDSDRFACDFTVDVETDGSASLRFGDGQLGRQPVPGMVFHADYRLGNGASCNIGAEALAHIVSDDGRILRIRNLMAAVGGSDPESTDSIRFNAPEAYLAPARAVTADDYKRRAETYVGVRKAAAELRWTGSWHSAFVYVAPHASGPADAALCRRVQAHLAPWQLAGCDVKVLPARYVALDVVLSVHVDADFFASTVQAVLTQQFGHGMLADGTLALFHPDRFDFGQSLYLSQLLTAAAAVPGVRRVDAVRFQRYGQAGRGELAAGQIDVGPHQIVRVDNDPAAPHHGTIRFIMKGGA